MTPEKLAKIRALAEDARGDPATRAIAMAALKRYAKEPEFHDVPDDDGGGPDPDPRHPGVRPNAQWTDYVLHDLNSWKLSANGNRTHVTKHKDRFYRITMFKFKKGIDAWGWVRIRTTIQDDRPVFSGRFATLAEAHQDACKALKAI